MGISVALGPSLFRTKTAYEPYSSGRGDLIRAQDVHRRPKCRVSSPHAARYESNAGVYSAWTLMHIPWQQVNVNNCARRKTVAWHQRANRNKLKIVG